MPSVVAEKVVDLVSWGMDYWLCASIPMMQCIVFAALCFGVIQFWKFLTSAEDNKLNDSFEYKSNSCVVQEEEISFKHSPLQRRSVPHHCNYSVLPRLPSRYGLVIATTRHILEKVEIVRIVTLKDKDGTTNKLYLLKCKTKSSVWFTCRSLEDLKQIHEKIENKTSKVIQTPWNKFYFTERQRTRNINYYLQNVISFVKRHQPECGSIIYDAFQPSSTQNFCEHPELQDISLNSIYYRSEYEQIN